MSTRIVRLYPNVEQMALGGIRATKPVDAIPIFAAGETANWLIGRGVPLVIDGGKNIEIDGFSTENRTFRYYIAPSSIHSTLIAYISMSSNRIDLEPTAASGWYLVVATPEARPVLVNGDSYYAGAPEVVVQPFANPGTGGITIGITAGGLSIFTSVLISSIVIFEAPLLFLDGIAGCTPPTPKELIYDGYSSDESIAGVAKAAEQARGTYFKRGALFTWSAGYTQVFSNTTYAELFPVKPSIQNRAMYALETSRNAKVVVYAKVSGGTGNVRITMASGGVVTFNITSTTGAWTTPTNIAVETDDYTRWDTDGGIRGGSRDTVTVEYRAAAAQTITIESVCIYDEPG